MKDWSINLVKGLILILILFNIVFYSTDTFANQDNMNQEDIRILISKAKDAWIAQDADALAQMFTPDGEMIVPGKKWRGQAIIREEINNFAQQYSDVKIDIQRIIVENNQAAVEWYYQDTHKATGRRNQADDVIVVDFKDGLISRWREYFDTETPASKQ
ncbi:nuclear transport factor 2 family protein [aff. Roholtiella sp. LEGE 12411]|uniref:nuclear transport factor 2 family protein n=1 Tax=aff. Roholtiella sp. LEGE 12411 TaxID=1828822 RepID=UPI001881AC2D|nr:nuclear transport factor 2 family protein [aff. Roholtiella sp. LEGE 12411]MBE9037752.1 nuclear transport factor 2 family protein [aff. Roholtiella sp. LEGE 12411]